MDLLIHLQTDFGVEIPDDRAGRATLRTVNSFVGSDPDFADRFEIGLLDPAIGAPVDGRITGLPLPTHQADRARLENELARRCRAGRHRDH